MKFILLVLGVLVINQVSFSQDSNKVFTPDAFAFYVKKYHPISVQASLISKRAESEVQTSKGGFDPMLYTVIDEKNYSDKNYYSLLDAGLKIPTWFGVEFKAAYQQNAGIFLNPENEVPLNGQFLAGANISLLQGMFIDERRAMLKQSKLLLDYSQNEQKVVLNDLILEAFESYWSWVNDYNQLLIQQKAVVLAETRYKALVKNYLQGEQPAIDTLEAYIQYQTRLYTLNDATLKLQQSRLYMSTYLWYENNVPLEINERTPAPVLNVKATITAIDSINKAPIIIDDNHPLLQQYQLKLSQLEIDRRLKAEKLKPKLNVNYNFINEPVNAMPFDGMDFQNAKWGVNFSFPIFIRKERGDLNIAKIKIRETDLGRDLKAYDLTNKSNAVITEINTLKKQLDLYETVVINYDRLLQAERQKFDNGESSVFLVNARELSLIQAEISYVSLGAKYQQSFIKRQWVQGVLSN